MRQGALALRTWGGKRPGAGRKPAGEMARAVHTARERIRASQPVHVTLRVSDHVWNLRSERAYAAIHSALDSVRSRPGFGVVHFSVQGNHLHLIVEASGERSLANGMKSLTVRLARRLNRMMGRSGSVFEDRFHAHVLRTPAEARNAVRYVLENHASHRERLGLAAARDRADPYSSAVVRVPMSGQLELWKRSVATGAGTWLMREGERGSVRSSPGAHARFEAHSLRHTDSLRGWSTSAEPAAFKWT